MMVVPGSASPGGVALPPGRPPPPCAMGFLITRRLISSTVVGILIGLVGGIATGKPEFAPVSNAASVAVLMGVLAFGMATRPVLQRGVPGPHAARGY
ncbi:MAG: hypothetical protein U1F77_14625 [Kiritimatiellia bacterium]